MSNVGEAPEGRNDRRQLSARDRIVGLAVLAGIVALLVFLRTPDEPSPVADLFLPPAAPLGAEWLRRAPHTAPWDAVTTDYAAGRYVQAAEELDGLTDDDDSGFAQLMVGSCHLLAGRPKQAELALRLAARSEDREIAHEARWRLAISLLRQEEMDAGRAELDALARENGARSSASRTLLEQLAPTSSRIR
jgi:hypothetical protein